MVKKSIDYNDVLNDLKSKKASLLEELKGLDDAIFSFEKLTGNQTIQSDLFPKNSSDLPKGVYEASAAILAYKGSKMKTSDIIQELINRGAIDKDTPFANVATTLYKAVKDKKDCKIKLLDKGVWGLSTWR